MPLWSNVFLFMSTHQDLIQDNTNELSMLPVSSRWCADRVFCHSHHKRPSRTLSIAQFSTGVPQLWACAKIIPRTIKRSREQSLYLSEVSFPNVFHAVFTWQVELLKPVLNITVAVIAEVFLWFVFARGRISLTGAVHCHIMPYRTLDICRCLTLEGLRKELFQVRRTDGRHSHIGHVIL